uniref:Uncharacterized protein n=1 Tax=Arundo donax TaxID=35708 RepID=A0A0A8YEF7_ARUDO
MPRHNIIILVTQFIIIIYSSCHVKTLNSSQEALNLGPNIVQLLHTEKWMPSVPRCYV